MRSRVRARPRLPAAAVLVTVGAVAAVLAACSALVDLDDLGGGEPDAFVRADRRGSDDPDSRQPVAPPDTGAAPPGVRCEAGLAFCDDFERGEPRGAWTQVLATSDASVAIATESSGNRFLEAVAPADDAGRGVELVRLEAAADGRATLSARVRVDDLPADGRVELFGVAFQAVPTAYVLVVWTGGRLVLSTPSADAGPAETPLAAARLDGAWHDVRLAVSTDATRSLATLVVDGAEAEASFAPLARAPLQAFVGLHYVEVPGELRAHVDDVALGL